MGDKPKPPPELWWAERLAEALQKILDYDDKDKQPRRLTVAMFCDALDIADIALQEFRRPFSSIKARYVPLEIAERLAEALDLELTHHCKGSMGCPECRRVREAYREWREFRRAMQQEGEP